MLIAVAFYDLFLSCTLSPALVPPPSMSVSLSPSGTIYESTLLVITCNASLPSTVDTDVSATVTWTGPNGMVNTDAGRIIVGQAVAVGNNVFQSVLKFYPVDNGDAIEGTDDAGQYTCEMVISSNYFRYLYIDAILNGNNSISEDIVVTGMTVSIEN